MTFALSAIPSTASTLKAGNRVWSLVDERLGSAGGE